MIRTALLVGKKLTALQALRDYGCNRLAARINELRNAGFPVHTDWIETDTGKRVAQYSYRPPIKPDRLF